MYYGIGGRAWASRSGMSSMALALLIAGIFAVVAGLFMGFFGTRLWDFSGNDGLMVLVAAIGVSSGLLLIGVYAVVVELKKITQQLGATALAEVSDRLVLPPIGEEAPEEEAALEEEAFGGEPTLPASSVTRPSWLGDATRGRQRTEPPAPEVPAPPADEVPRRRNSFASRRERDSTPPEPAPDALELPAPSSPRFEVAWPKPERSRPRETSVLRRPSAPSEPSTPTEPAMPEPAEQLAVTVLKSGVVDGMAYSLYSDGSIEAQLPEGMLRFASIDELRTHIDQRS